MRKFSLMPDLYAYLARSVGTAEDHVSTVDIAPRTAFHSAGGFNKHCVRGVPDPWGVNVKVSCKATYILTQEDIDAGVVENIVR